MNKININDYKYDKQQNSVQSDFGKSLKQLINSSIPDDIPDKIKSGLEIIDKDGKYKEVDPNTGNKEDEQLYDFLHNCIENSDENNKHYCGRVFADNYDDDVIKSFELILKDLKFDHLRKIAWQLELKQKINGFYESVDEWEKHINFITVNIDTKEYKLKDNTITGLFKNEYEKILKNSINGNPPNDIRNFNELPDDDRKAHYNRINNGINRIKNFIRVLSYRLNNQIRENMKKENKYSDVHSSYIKQSIQPSPIHNDAYILRSYSPYIPMLFYGGKYEFKPNNNQAADILKKLFDALVNNLKAQNKYLNEQDKKDVYAALDKIKQLETRIAELITNGYNFVQNNSDITQQKINLDKINTEIMKTNEKVVSLRQKIDYIITKLYNEQIEKDKKDDVVKKDFS